MDALLPAFVDRLLGQGPDPCEIPVSATAGWLGPLATRVLSVVETITDQRVQAFLAHGYVYLPLPAPDGRGVYLRVASHSAMEPWPVLTTSVVLTIAGTVAVEMYQEVDDSLAGRPQYARSFGPEQVFAVHPDTLCATQSSPDGVQVLATVLPTPRSGEPLTEDEYAAAVYRVYRTLEGLRHGTAAGDRS
ncbi:hypothetical protein ACWD5R_17860 [Streptomyces sp. NPDC002514]|uniref:hypothetical protein n=1 Tax=Streptomyces sp. NPDC001270 TaxID=3364554 RepID=UPI0036C7E114